MARGGLSAEKERERAKVLRWEELRHVQGTEIRRILKIELTGHRTGLYAVGGRKGPGSKVTPVFWGGVEELEKRALAGKEEPWCGTGAPG